MNPEPPDLFRLMIEVNNWRMWEYFKRVEMACFICKRTGIRECDPKAAEIQCMICGFCEREKEREEGDAAK